MYGKLFDSMFDGTLRGHWQAIVTLQQMVILADANGIVDMTPQAISDRTTIPLDIIVSGLQHLAMADPYTRTPGEEGRRIVLLDDHRPWGWRLVNHAKYKALRNMAQKHEDDRIRIAEKRKKIKDVAIESQMSPMQYADAYADTDADAPAKAETKGNNQGRAIALPEWLPLDLWQAWLKTRKAKSNHRTALLLAIAKLEKWRAAGMDPRAVLEQSVVNGWQGLFELRADSVGKSPPPQKKSCAYCGAPSCGMVSGIWHCSAHLDAAMDGKPRPSA